MGHTRLHDEVVMFLPPHVLVLHYVLASVDAIKLTRFFGSGVMLET
jgi:hypothetical protein